jgi:hypothetical protein
VIAAELAGAIDPPRVPNPPPFRGDTSAPPARSNRSAWIFVVAAIGLIRILMLLGKGSSSSSYKPYNLPPYTYQSPPDFSDLYRDGGIFGGPLDIPTLGGDHLESAKKWAEEIRRATETANPEIARAAAAVSRKLEERSCPRARVEATVLRALVERMPQDERRRLLLDARMLLLDSSIGNYCMTAALHGEDAGAGDAGTRARKGARDAGRSPQREGAKGP